MNREIKFRVWDSKEKKMLYEYDGFYETVDVLEGVWRWFNALNKIAQQYTGLKDKNGKEIYEGDIVKDSAGRLWVIKWQQPIARFVFELVEFEKKKFNGRIGKPTRTTLQAYLTEMDEVIGNIYENSELLAQTNSL